MVPDARSFLAAFLWGYVIPRFSPPVVCIYGIENGPDRLWWIEVQVSSM